MRGAVLLWLVAALAVATGAVVDATYACQGSEIGFAALQSNGNVTVRRTKGLGYEFLISPVSGVAGGFNLTRGIVIIPEYRVAPEAYAPLARALALKGCYSAIIDTPTPGLTIQVLMQKPDVLFWTVAGHGTTGGGLASRLVLTLQPKVKVLILLASALPADVNLVDVNVAVVALYGGRDTVVTPKAVEESFARFPGDADVLALAEMGHYDFAYSECEGNVIHPGPKDELILDADFSNILEKIFIAIRFSSWVTAGYKALSFSNNESLIPGKNISKPYPGDIRVHYTQVPIPNTNPQRWWWAFTPTVIKGGLVYYPGAAVDARAYFPLAFEIAARGHLVVIIQMPLRYASFEEANIVIDSPNFRQVPNGKWAVGGHSLGGFATSLYVASFGKRIYAAVMHAGGWLANLTENPLPIVNIYGTLDNSFPGGYDRFRYLYTDPPPKGNGPLVNLKTTKFVAVEGANHAQVGDYGQGPNEVAIISMEKQWIEFAKETIVFLESVVVSN